MFHRRCGDRVNLTNNNCTAVRNFSEYNYGLVLSSEPLKDDELFEVRIDKKMMSWSGSIEIGITSCDPETMELPASAKDLVQSSWIMTSTGIVHDGEPLDLLYGTDLECLEEGNTVGVMRTTKNELLFYINGVSQGVAATNVPSRVFAVIDMYGNCVQVTITHPRVVKEVKSEEAEINNDFTVGEASNSSTTNLVANLNVNLNVNVNVNLPKNPTVAAIREDRLKFHERVGSLVKLSNNARTSERQRPLDEFNNGVVMTHRPLRDNELFEIRIDRLVDKWSGSIEVGVTTHSPTALEFPATMTNMRSGTTMMSGCGILTNGKGTQREYGEFNLDELREGDRVGMIRRSNSNLHYLINGLDQGVAAKVPSTVWGVIDLYGMTVKVTIVDRDERDTQNLVTRRNTLHLQELNESAEDESTDRLMFHPCCGTHASVINNGRTAHRPNAIDDFNNGVVLTSRPLRPNELFEVRLNKVVTKWAGSIEIGVTTHSPTELEFPFTMTNVRSGTWMMTGNGVMHNGTTMIDHYGQNLDRLQVGDRVGVMRKDNSTLHFYVNGADQGVAAMGVPDRVYGVIDLYGQAAQATIVDNTDYYSPATNNSSFSNTTSYSDLRFHHIHGRNARIMNYGLTASRPRALGEFNEAIVIANRPLRDNEMFEVTIDKMVDRWSGAIEAGVTAIRPDELVFPSTMTDIDHDTWILSGSTVMCNGVTLRNNYTCDLDSLVENNRIGLMRWDDSSLHYYLDGVDQGPACTGLPPQVYPVIDLYGRCAQVTIVQPERRDTMTQQYLASENSTSQQPTSVIQPQAHAEITHKFHESVGLNVQLQDERQVARRCREYNNAVVLSESALENNELFEVVIKETADEWSGSLKIGVVTKEIGYWLTSMNLVSGLMCIPNDSWYLVGNEVMHKGNVLCLNYCPSLDWLQVGDKIGLKRTQEANLKFYINGEDMGIAATNVPELVYAIVDLYGSTLAVRVTSNKQPYPPISPNASLRLQDSLELLLDPIPPITRNDPGMDTSTDASEAKLLSEMILTLAQPPNNFADEAATYAYEFHENHGRNIEIERRSVARRVASYNQGIVMSSKPLISGKMFQVKVEKVNDRWKSSMLCGVTCVPPEKASFPVTALGFKKLSWIVCSEWIFYNGTKIKTNYGANLESLQVGQCVGLLLNEDSSLRIYINGVDQGIAATDLPQPLYAVFDLYGQCEQISIIDSLEATTNYSNSNVVAAATLARCESEVEDLENSREKADLECHEKESSSSLPVEPNESAQSKGEMREDNDAPSETPVDVLQVKSVSSSVHSENSESSSENCGKMKNCNGNQSVEENENNVAETAEVEQIRECTNVDINNFTNINIKNGTTASCSANLASNALNTANANNAINECIASNSPMNSLSASFQHHPLASQNFNITSDATSNRRNNSAQNLSNILLHQQTSIASTPIVSSSNVAPSRKCEYLKATMRLKKSLVLPDEFFSSDEVTCYCQSCYKVDGDCTTTKKGEPPAEYVIPIGWARFPLKQSINANQIPQLTTDKWHVAFYGTRLDSIRWILDRGELLSKEQLDASYLTINITTEDQNPQVVFYPNIKNTTTHDPSRKYPYFDPQINKKLSVSTAFQLLVRPGSYTVSPGKDIVEWATKEAGATTINALLIHLDGF